MFAVFTGLFYISTNSLSSRIFSTDDSKTGENPVKEIHLQSRNPYDTKYFFNVEYFQNEKQLEVKQKIIWVNNNSKPTAELYFNLFPNAFLNNKTNYLHGIGLSEESMSGFVFSKILVNGEKSDLIYVLPSNQNRFDSTVAKIELGYKVEHGHSVIIEFDYLLKIPKAIGRFGYESDGNFVFLGQWYPRICVYEKGIWNYNHYHPFAEFNYDFASFNFELKLPDSYSVVATGTLVESKQINGFSFVKFSHNNQIDFAWVIATESKTLSFEVEAKGKIIKVDIFEKNLNESRLNRIKKSASNAIQYLSEHIGEFPYDKISLVQVPNKDSRIANMEYPSLITFSSQYFSPEFTLNPEETIIHEIVHQYFYATVVNNETDFAWLDEGFANYLTSKIIEKYYPPKTSYFKFFGELPIRGLLLLELEQVPLVYSLATITKPNNVNSLSAYYQWGNYVSLTDSSSKFNTYNHYFTHAYARGELFLKSIENMIGEKRFLSVLRKYYSTYFKQRVTHDDFLKTVKGELSDEEFSYVESWYKSIELNDFKIVSITKDFNENNYNLLIEKEGDIEFPLEIEVHTFNDTLKFNWSGKESHANIQFYTKDEIIYAIVDPHRKNPFDKNLSNNSLTISTQFGGALSISLRFFFWVQNFLMVFGGIF
jgi:hypothetical protein